jgi:hypothetical protein
MGEEVEVIAWLEGRIVLHEHRGHERGLLQEEAARRIGEEPVAAALEVRREGVVRATVKRVIGDHLAEGLVRLLDLGRRPLVPALVPVDVHLLAGLAHDDVGDVVRGGPARGVAGLERGAEQVRGRRRRGGDQGIPRLRCRAGVDLRVVPEQALELRLDHQQVVLAVDEAVVLVLEQQSRERVSHIGFHVDEVLEGLHDAHLRPLHVPLGVRRVGDVGQAGPGGDVVAELEILVADREQIDLDPRLFDERRQDSLEGGQLLTAPCRPDVQLSADLTACGAGARGACGARWLRAGADRRC